MTPKGPCEDQMTLEFLELSRLLHPHIYLAATIYRINHPKIRQTSIFWQNKLMRSPLVKNFAVETLGGPLRGHRGVRGHSVKVGAQKFWLSTKKFRTKSQKFFQKITNFFVITKFFSNWLKAEKIFWLGRFWPIWAISISAFSRRKNSEKNFKNFFKKSRIFSCLERLFPIGSIRITKFWPQKILAKNSIFGLNQLEKDDPGTKKFVIF